jgi:hypothetical protein
MIASGVRNSCEAFAANRRCSATCASSWASIASKLSASSWNSSSRPSIAIRCASDPFAARRVAAVICASGASMRPASSHPPSTPNTSRKPSASAAAGTNARMRSSRPGTNPPMVCAASCGTYLRRNSQTTASKMVPASTRNPA